VAVPQREPSGECAGGSPWANKTENRVPNRKNGEPKPNRIETENFGSFSVPGSQEPKFSVRFGSWTRLTEEPASWYIQPINYLSPLEHRPNCVETLAVRLSLSPSPSPTPVSQSQPPIPHSAVGTPVSLPSSISHSPSLPARRRPA